MVEGLRERGRGIERGIEVSGLRKRGIRIERKRN